MTTSTVRPRTTGPDALVLDHLDLARTLAGRYRNRGESFDDLLQVAFLGLVKAARGYRPEEGNSFAAYATPTITGEIRRHFRDHGWNVRPPRRLQELRARIRLLERELEQELLEQSCGEELLARRLGTTVAEVREARCAAAAYSAVSLDAPVGEDDATLADTLAVEGVDPAAVIDDIASLAPAIARFDERDRRMLALRFGGERTQSQIAAELGISQMQVSRRLGSLLARLREALTGEPAQVPVRAVTPSERLRSTGETVPACPRIPSSSSTSTSRAA